MCDGVDNDCSGFVDDDPVDGTTWYADYDGDGWGADSIWINACTQPEGYLATAGDCNDFSVLANPDQVEVCDWIDNDCNGIVDDPDLAPGATDWWVDEDSDGYGSADGQILACFAPVGYTDNPDDCDDGADDINPGMQEICNNGIDEDCSGDGAGCTIPASGSALASKADVVFEGDASSDYFGSYALDLLDLDGDGHLDVIIGASGTDEPYSYAGSVHAYYGPLDEDEYGGSDADAVFTPGTATSSNYLGRALQRAGDVNGDGYDDFVAGAYYKPHPTTGTSGAGAGYLVYGSSTQYLGDVDIEDYASFHGETGSTFDYFGSGVAGVGDLDADGYDDFAFGAYSNDTGGSSGGAIYLFHGSASDYAGSYEATDADAKIYGGQYLYFGYYFGQGVNAGDLNGDGYSDMVIGTGSYSSSDPLAGYGGVYLRYGDAAQVSGSQAVPGWSDALLKGDALGDYFGRTVELGDIDGDGYDDVIVGQYYADTSGGSYAGRAWMFLGGSVDLAGFYEAGVDEHASIEGAASSDYLGDSVQTGDFDNDGYTDLVVGASGVDMGASTGGAAFIFYGTLAAGTYTSADADTSLYGSSSSMYLGRYGATAAGDVNADGIDDLLVGTYGGTSSYNGSAHLWYGGGM